MDIHTDIETQNLFEEVIIPLQKDIIPTQNGKSNSTK